MRFKEYKDKWFEVKLKDIIKIKSGKDQKGIINDNGKYNIYGTGGIIGKTNYFLYDKESVGIGRKGTIDKPFYFSKPFWTVDTLFYSEIKTGIAKFIYYLFQTINWLLYNQSTGVPSLTSSVIENISVNIPIISEQEKIALFLSSIDDRIETQKKIINAYSSLMNSISNNIFHRINNNEDINLGSFAKIYQPETITENQFTDKGNYNVFGANGIIGKYNNYNHENAQICISCRGASCGKVNLSTPFSWITGNSMVINIDNSQKKYDKKFLFYYLAHYNFKSIISGSGQPQITRKPIQMIKVPNISIESQIKYKNILDKIDLNIEYEKKILSLYEKQKQYLLNKMFI